jgi:murein DD-endopeptidase MepM/ murein hydrolase activator NlpD
MPIARPSQRRSPPSRIAVVAAVLGVAVAVAVVGGPVRSSAAAAAVGASPPTASLAAPRFLVPARSGPVGGRAVLGGRTGWRWPVGGPGGSAPTVTRGFAPPATRYGSGHRGVDLSAPPGSPVLASGTGVVAFAGMLAGRGVISIDHGPLRTTYEPVEPEVRVGQAVGAGDVIGTLAPGHPGCPAGAGCLHWGLRRGADYLDPLGLLRPQHSRLLPVWGIPVPARSDPGQELPPFAVIVGPPP